MPSIIGFEQDPEGQPGQGLFHFDTGQSLYAHDPETAAPFLEQQPDQRLAMADPVGGWRQNPGEQVADVGPNYSADPTEPEQMSVDQPVTRAPDPVGYSAAPAPETNVSAPPPMSVDNGQPAPAPQAPIVGAPAVQMSPDEQYRAQMAGYLNQPYARTGGGGRGRMVPQSTTIETTAAPDTDADRLAREDLNINYLMAKRAEYDTQIQRYQNQQLALAAQQPLLRQQAVTAQMWQENVNRAVYDDRAKLDQLLTAKESKEANFDPNRFYTNASVVSKIGSVIAQAFGAYASTITGGKNWAKEILDDAIHRDIQQQQAEINALGGKANNALARLNRTYGDMDQAKAALEIAQRRVAENVAGYMAAGEKTEEAQNAFRTFVAGNQIERAQAEKNFENAAYGKHTTKLAYQAPGAGGVNQHQQFMNRAAELKQMQELGVMPKPIDGKVDESIIEKYGKERAAIVDAEEALKDTARKAGITFDPETGMASVPEGHDIPGKGATGWVPTPLQSQAGQDLQQSLRVLAQRQTKAVSGATATEEEKADIRKGIEGYYDAGLVKGLEMSWQQLQARKQAIEATHGTPAARTWEERNRIAGRRMANEGKASQVGPAIGRIR